jgi:hemerythrin
MRRVQILKIEEWKKTQDEMTQAVYDILKGIGAKDAEREETFSDSYYLALPADQFPYDRATEIRAQYEGTGDACRYELRFYYWVKPLRVVQTFNIDTDEQNKTLIDMLKKTDQLTREKIVKIMQHELDDFRKHFSSEDPVYTAWRMQEPSIRGKIRRIEDVIRGLILP